MIEHRHDNGVEFLELREAKSSWIENVEQSGVDLGVKYVTEVEVLHNRDMLFRSVSIIRKRFEDAVLVAAC